MSALLNETSTLVSGWNTSYALPTAAAILASAVLYSALFPTAPKDTAIQPLGGFSIVTAWQFFDRRFDFLRSNFSKTGQNLFSFKVLQHSVVAIKGEAARKAFFDDRSLDFIEGYRILMGGAPRLKDIDAPTELKEDVSWFNKQLFHLFHKDRLTELLPTLLDDIQDRMEGWGKEGRMDPFKDIYNLVFQMTVRMASCRELATDTAVVDKLQKDYWLLEKSATPTALLLPWFPSKDKKNKEAATKRLFTTLHDYVELRKKSDVPTLDAIDILLGKGLSSEDTISVILSIIFAGVINTGINSCWALLFLSFHKEWKQKVIEEVNALIQTHTNTISTDPLHKRLSAIPVSAWEEGMPTLELVLRETLRLTMNGTALRRNIFQDLNITNKRLPKGDFLAYSLSDAHLNPDIYDSPHDFDPTRFLPGREENKKQNYGYIAWGAGRHPCAGMKVAKLEIKVVVAFFLAGYEYDVVDSEGKFPEQLPKPDYNDIHQTRPLGEPCYIQFKRVVD